MAKSQQEEREQAGSRIDDLLSQLARPAGSFRDSEAASERAAKAEDEARAAQLDLRRTLDTLSEAMTSLAETRRELEASQNENQVIQAKLHLASLPTRSLSHPVVLLTVDRALQTDPVSADMLPLLEKCSTAEAEATSLRHELDGCKQEKRDLEADKAKSRDELAAAHLRLTQLEAQREQDKAVWDEQVRLQQGEAAKMNELAKVKVADLEKKLAQLVNGSHGASVTPSPASTRFFDRSGSSSASASSASIPPEARNLVAAMTRNLAALDKQMQSAQDEHTAILLELCGLHE
ncbi:hypothetical protein JCM10213_004855 [Rhodosporidiobolus nylandii]